MGISLRKRRSLTLRVVADNIISDDTELQLIDRQGKICGILLAKEATIRIKPGYIIEVECLIPASLGLDIIGKAKLVYDIREL